MNVIKLILTIGTVFGIAARGAMPSMADTITWNGDGVGNSWHNGDNWVDDVSPVAGDDVVIPGSSYLVVISADDAACETLDIGATSRLEIKGKTLTLGASGTPTTSTLDAGTGGDADGTIRFVKDGSTAGTLSVHQLVTFNGGGTIEALTASDLGIIDRASGSDGIVISATSPAQPADNAVFGNITLLCDVENKGTRFGVNVSDQLMVFGSDDGEYLAPLISGDGEIRSFLGKIQFRIVTFAASAPKWVIDEKSEIEVTDDASPSHWVDVPFDIDMVDKDGLLDLHHHFSCTGKLHVTAGEGLSHTIEVADGIIAVWEP